MLKNNIMFQEQTLYTLAEVLHALGSSWTNEPKLSADDIKEFLKTTEMIEKTEDSGNYYFDNYIGLNFIRNTEHNYWSEDWLESNAVILLNKLYSRYSGHYAIVCDEDTSDEKWNKSKDILRKVFNLLDYTFTKYDILLYNYGQQKLNLLNKLGRTRQGLRSLSQTGTSSEQHSGSGTNSDTINNLDLKNDTPQTSDVVADISQNQYVSELRKGQQTSSGTTTDTFTNSGSSSSSGTDGFEETENFDTMTIMAKLDEIEKQFSQLWRKWLNEFDELFIEEVNY